MRQGLPKVINALVRIFFSKRSSSWCANCRQFFQCSNPSRIWEWAISAVSNEALAQWTPE